MTILTQRPDPLADLQQARLPGVDGAVAQRLTYVLDTSVLLSDPRAVLRFKEHEVVLHAEVPVVDKKVVAVERVKLDTETVTEQVSVSEELRKEQIELDDPTSTTR